MRVSSSASGVDARVGSWRLIDHMTDGSRMMELRLRDPMDAAGGLTSESGGCTGVASPHDIDVRRWRGVLSTIGISAEFESCGLLVGRCSSFCFRETITTDDDSPSSYEANEYLPTVIG